MFKKSYLYFTLFLSSCSLIPFFDSSSYMPQPQFPENQTPSEIQVFYYGRSLLKDNELKLYNEILNAYQNWEENANKYSDIHHRLFFQLYSKGIFIENVPQFIKVSKYVGNDHPEFFSANFSTAPRDPTYINGYYNSFHTLGIFGSLTRENYNNDLKRIKTQVGLFLSGIKTDMTDAQKVRYLHDRLLEHVGYSMNESLYKIADIRGSIISGRAICEGYSRGFLYILQHAGIKAFYTEGYIRISTVNNTWGLHAWVCVQIEGVWYYIDITSNDGIGNIGYHHDYFLIGQSEFDNNYKYDNGGGSWASFPIPSISPTNYPLHKTIY